MWRSLPGAQERVDELLALVAEDKPASERPPMHVLKRLIDERLEDEDKWVQITAGCVSRELGIPCESFEREIEDTFVSKVRAAYAERESDPPPQPEWTYGDTIHDWFDARDLPGILDEELFKPEGPPQVKHCGVRADAPKGRRVTLSQDDEPTQQPEKRKRAPTPQGSILVESDDDDAPTVDETTPEYTAAKKAFVPFVKNEPTPPEDAAPPAPAPAPAAGEKLDALLGDDCNLATADVRALFQAFLEKRPKPANAADKVKIHEETKPDDKGVNMKSSIFLVLDWAAYTYKRTRKRKPA
ncbi:hypothetical protein SO694_00007554 [Aureococcus anophagefferens]|uniref:Uncharacterized protein n=1 Tax=Aureococcus anophagefferens TaxID=44056 RepID=A0ABR1GBE5_AURAN